MVRVERSWWGNGRLDPLARTYEVESWVRWESKLDLMELMF